jgi:hypothetical protein
MWPFSRRTNTFVKPTKKKRPKTKWYVPRLTVLEDRILLSAAVGPFAGLGPVAERFGELAVANQTPSIQAGGPSGPVHDLIFVDSAVADYRGLLAGLPPLLAGGSQVVVLDSARDEIAQITDVLRSCQNVAAVYILSHGASGCLQLGNTRLDADTLGQYSAQLRSWKAGLADHADLLLYGCDIAEGATGVAFVDALSRLTGADVAASTNLTGNAQLGGDWNLEFATGTIEAAPLSFSAASFTGVLNVSSVSFGGLTIAAASATEITDLQNLFSGSASATVVVHGASVQLLTNVQLSGDFTFSVSAGQTVTVATGVPANLGALASSIPALATLNNAFNTLTGSTTTTVLSSDWSTISNLSVGTFTFSATNVTAFVGVNAPATSGNAVGLSITGLDIGGVLMAPTAAALPGFSSVLPKFYAVKATAASADLVGIPGVTASASGTEFHINGGWWSSAIEGVPGIPEPVVDFATSYPGDATTPVGFAVPVASGPPIYIDYGGDGIIGVKATNITLDLANAVHLSGSLDFEMGGSATVSVNTGLSANIPSALTTPLNSLPTTGTGLKWDASTGDISGLEVETMRLGIGNATAFIGANYGVDGSGNLNSNALGVYATGVDVGFVMMTPTLADLPGFDQVMPTFYALKATVASASLQGIPGVTATATGITVRVNGGSWPEAIADIPGIPGPVVDFQDSFPGDSTTNPATPAGYQITTGAGNSVHIDYGSDAIIGVKATNVTLDLAGSVHVTGSMDFEMGAAQTVTFDTGLAGSVPAVLTNALSNLPTGGTGLSYDAQAGTISGLDVETMRLGIGNATAFVGANYGLDGSGNLSSDAVGLYATGVDMGLVMMTPTLADLPGFDQIMPKFYALKATVATAGIFGVPGITATASGVEIDVNKGSWGESIANTPGLGEPDVDFAASFPADSTTTPATPAGYEVPTGAGNSVFIDFNGDPLIQVAVADANIKLSSFVYLRGSLDFTMGPILRAQPLAPGFITDISTAAATLQSYGLPPDIPVIGTSKDLSLMTIGGHGLHAFVGINNSNLQADGSVDAGAMGLKVDNLDFGMALMRPTDPLDKGRYFALKATASQADVVGISGVTATVTNLDLEVNQSTPSFYGLSMFPVVDFATKPLAVSTGAKDASGNPITVDLTMGSSLIKASGTVNMNVFGVVQLSGNLAFELGPTQQVTLTDGSHKTVSTMLLAGTHLNGYVGISSSGPRVQISDMNVGLAVMASTAIGDVGGYVALQADINSFSLQGIPGLSASGSLHIDLNVGFGQSGMSPTLQAVNFVTSFPTDSGLKIDTGDPSAPILIAYSSILVQVQLTGDVVVASTLDLNGTFYLKADSSGLEVYANANATLTGTPSNLFTIHAEGALVLKSTGIAASLYATVNVGAALSGLSLVNGAATAEFEMNFTGADQTVRIPSELLSHMSTASKAGLLTDSNGSYYLIPGAAPSLASLFPSDGTLSHNPLVAGTNPHYLVVGFAAQVQLGGAFTLNGKFGLLASATSFQLYAGASVDVGPLGTMGVSGSVTIDASGVVGNLTLTAGTPPNNLGFTLTATFTLDVDTPNSTVMVHAVGDLQLLSLTFTGTFDVTISAGGFDMAINASTSIFGVSFNVSGTAGLYSDGFEFSIGLGTTTVFPVAGKVSFGGTFQISANTTGTDHNGVAHNSASIAVTNTDVNLLGFIMHGDFTIAIKSNGLRVDASFNFDFFGVATFNVSGYLDTSTNSFSFTASASIGIGSSSWGVFGSASVTFASSGFSGSISGSVHAFGITVASMSASIDVNGTSVSASFSIYVQITPAIHVHIPMPPLIPDIDFTIPAVIVSGTATFTIGSTSPPGNPPPPPPPPVLATVLADGSLRLNIGADVGARGSNYPAVTGGENYVITRIGPGTNPGTEKLGVTGAGVSVPIQYDNVTKILVNDTQGGNDFIQIDSAVMSPVSINQGATPTGNNHIITGGGAATINGGTGADYLQIGSGGGSYAGGQGIQTITDNSPGTFTVSEAGYSNYSLNNTGTSVFAYANGTSAAAQNSIAFNNGAISTIHATGAAANTDFTVGSWNGTGTFTGVSGHSNRIKSTGDTDVTLTDSKFTNSTGASFDLQSIGTAWLTNDTGNNTFDVSGWTGAGNIVGGSGNNTVSASNDVNFTLSDSTLSRSGGHGDLALSGVGNATLTGGAGNNTFNLSGWSGTASLDGGAGTDTIQATNDANFTIGNSLLQRSGLGDVSLASFENMSLTGGAGNNTFDVSAWTGTGSLDGGAGTDTVRATNNTDFTITNTQLQRSGLSNLSLTNVENFSLTGGAGNNAFDVSGWTGTGSLDGGAGTDTVNATNDTNFTITNTQLQRGGSGNISLANIENTNLTGGAGNNTFDVSGWSGTGTMSGAGGTDTIKATDNTNFAILDARLSRTGFADLTLTSIGNFALTGGAGNNTFDVTGWTGTGSLDGSAGTDTVKATNDANFAITNTLLQRTGHGDISLAATEIFLLTGGAGNNTFTVTDWSGTGTLSGLGGTDTANIIKTTPNTGTLTNTNVSGLGLGAAGISYDTIETLNVNLSSGADTFNVQSTNAATLTTINAGTGDDIINVSSNAPAAGIVDNIAGPLFVNGQGGADFLNVDDSSSSSGKTGALTNSQLLGLAMGAQGITYTGLARLDVHLGSGSDTFNIRSTAPATTVYTGGGTNTINVDSNAGVSAAPGIVDNIQGALTVVGNSADTLNMDDTGSTTGKTGSLTSSTLTGLGMGPLGITYSGLANLNIHLGTGLDTFNVLGTAPITTTTLTTGADSNTNVVNVGNLVHKVDDVQGLLIVTGNGVDTLNVDDTGSTSGKTGSLTSSTLSGLGMGPLGITYSGLANLNIHLGTGLDTFNVLGTAAITTTTLTTGADSNANVVNVGNPSHKVDDVQGPLIVTGNGVDTLNVDDTGSTSGKTGFLTSSTLTGLGMGPQGIAYSGLANLNIHLGTGLDTFNVLGTAAITTTALTTGADSNANVVNVGNLVHKVDDVQGHLIVIGNGLDTLNVDDTGSTSGKTGFLTSSTLTGLAMGPQGITYSGLANLNIHLGTGLDTFNVLGTAAITTTTLTTGADSNANVVNVGNLVHKVDDVQGALIVIGNGLDTLNVDDTGSTAVKSGLLTDTQLTGLAMGSAGITYSGIILMNVSLGTTAAGSGNTFTAESTGSRVTNIHAGNGNDQVRVNYDQNGQQTFVNGVGKMATDAFTMPAGVLSQSFTLANLPTDSRFVFASLPGQIINNVAVSGKQVTVTLNQALAVPAQLLINYLVSILNIFGGTGDDQFLIGIGSQGSSLVNVLAQRNAAQTNHNTLTINGTNAADKFLLRRNLVASLAYDAQGVPQVQRVNYDTNISAGLTVNGLAGDDSFYLDDNSAVTTINGNGGNNTFQVGQLFNSPRDPANANVPAIDAFATTLATRGYLSNGVSFDTTINGGGAAGELESFTVYRNLAPLHLFGGAGDAIFTIRAFAAEGSVQSSVEGGAGANLIQYVLNAVLDVTGGTGTNTLKLIGTEFDDAVVVTSNGLIGMGTHVNYTGIQKLEIDLGEGNDTFYVVSTNPATQTILEGGLGSDRFVIGGDVPEIDTVDAQGHNVVLFPATHGPHSLAGIDNLTINGAGGSGTAAVLPPVMLPGETNILPATGNVISYTGTGQAGTIDHMVIDGSNLAAVGITNPLVTPITNPLAQLIGLTLQVTSGPGQGRFWLITGVTAGSGNTYNLTLQNVSVPAAGWTVPNPGIAPSQFTITHLSTNFFVSPTQSIDTATVYNDAATQGQTATLTSTQLTGLGMATGITYSKLYHLTVNLGSGNDTFQMNSTGPGNTTINAGVGADTINVRSVAGHTLINTRSGRDTINVGSNQPASNGVVDNINALLTINSANNVANAGQGDIVNVDDTGTTNPTTGFLTGTRLSGLGMNALTPAYLNNIQTVTVNAAGGTFTLTVLGQETAPIPFNASAAAVLQALLPIVNPTTYILNNLAVDKVGANVYEIAFQGAYWLTQNLHPSVALGHSTLVMADGTTPGTVEVISRLFDTPVGAAPLGLNYYGVGTLNINLGSGGNVFNIQSTSTVTNVNTGPNTNTVNVSSLAPIMTGAIVDNIQGPLTIIGSGTDALNLDDTGSTVDKIGQLTYNTITGLRMGPAGITYSGLATLLIDLGSGNNLFSVLNTTNNLVATTTTTIDTGSGTDLVNLFAADALGDSPTMSLLDRTKRGTKITGLGGPIFLQQTAAAPQNSLNVFLDTAYLNAGTLAKTHNFNYVDTAIPYTKTQLAADPTKGIVYTPGPGDIPTANTALVATTGRLIADSGTYNPNVWFADVNGAFSITGSGNAAGHADMLTVLGHSTTGLASSFDVPSPFHPVATANFPTLVPFNEPTTANGSTTFNISDTQVTSYNATLGTLRTVTLPVSGGNTTFDALLVRGGNEANAIDPTTGQSDAFTTVGDRFVVTPSARLNLFVRGGDKTFYGGDTLQVLINGTRTLARVTDPTLWPSTHIRIGQTSDGGSVGYSNIQTTNVPFTVTGDGSNSVVTVYDADSQFARYSLTPYPNFTGGAHVAVGDVNGDAIPDIIVAPGPGMAPLVRVYDGVTGNLLAGPLGGFYAYNSAFTGGVWVAAADVNGDGYADIVTGPDAGLQSPVVNVFSGAPGQTGLLPAAITSFSAIGDPNSASSFRGGVRVAAGNVTGDGRPEIVTSLGEAGAPVIRVFRGDTGIAVPGVMGTGLQVFDSTVPGGVFVALGNLLGTVTPWGEHLQQIIVGGTINSIPQVRTFSGLNGGLLSSFPVFDPVYHGGVRVGAVDVSDSGVFSILVSSGLSGSPSVFTFDAATLQNTRQFQATLGAKGVFVGGGGGGGDISAWNTGTALSVAPTPSATGPSGGVIALLPTLTWSPVSGATSYDIWLNDVTSGAVGLLHGQSSATSWTATSALTVGDSYIWWVRGVGAGNSTGPWSGAATFNVAGLPVPVPTAPLGGVATLAPTFTWNAVGGADYYDVWVDDTTTGQSQVLRNTKVTGTSWAPTTMLTVGHAYKWWVRALTNNGNFSAWGTGATFSVTPLPAPAPAPVTVAGATPSFSWSAVAGADLYDVWVNDSTTGQSQVLRNTQITGNSWTASFALTPAHAYQWWVRAVNAGGDTSPWSAGTGFAIALLNAPAQLGPNNTTASSATPTFQWASVAGAASYDLWADDLTTGQTEVVRNTQLAATSWTATSPLVPGHKYQWWVRAFSADGDYSPWSTASFTIAAGAVVPPSGSAPPIPANLTLQVAGIRPTYAWSAVAGASYYDVWVNDLTSGQGEVLRSQSSVNSLASTGTLTPGHAYQWWVRAFTGTGATSGWSSGATFTAASMPVPVLVGPNGTLSAASVLLNWTATAGADSYDIWIDDTTAGQTQAVRTQAGSLSFAPQLLRAGHAYQWWVRSLSVNGFYGAWSSSFTFSLT